MKKLIPSFLVTLLFACSVFTFLPNNKMHAEPNGAHETRKPFPPASSLPIMFLPLLEVTRDPSPSDKWMRLPGSILKRVTISNIVGIADNISLEDARKYVEANPHLKGFFIVRDYGDLGIPLDEQNLVQLRNRHTGKLEPVARLKLNHGCFVFFSGEPNQGVSEYFIKITMHDVYLYEYPFFEPNTQSFGLNENGFIY